MKFPIIITEPAEDDADAIYLWLQKRSQRGAVNWWKAFSHAADSLRQNADSFGLAPESTDHPEAIREFTFSTRHGDSYRLIYILLYPSRRHCLRFASPGHWPIVTLSR